MGEGPRGHKSPMMNFWKSRGAGNAELDQAIQAMRRVAEQRPPSLSASSRATVLAAVHGTREIGTSGLLGGSVFAARTRLLAAGALPVLLGVGLLVLLNGPVPPPPRDAAPPAPYRVSATKQGAQVQFKIVNGGGPHRVLRSTSPATFESSSAIHLEEGAFTDRIEDASGLVFYRIE